MSTPSASPGSIGREEVEDDPPSGTTTPDLPIMPRPISFDYSSAYRSAPFIGVAGIIGAGKTTLTKALATELKMDAAFEPVKTNPYLPLFYADIAKYSFNMQIFLLGKRFQQHQRIVWNSNGMIQDRTIYEDPIFALMLNKGKLMTDLDFQTYVSLFDMMSHFLHRPDMIVYLDVTPQTAYNRVQKRMKEQSGRECEKTISLEYLAALRDEYEGWISSGTRGIEVVRLDWNHPSSIDSVASLIRRKLHISSAR